MQVTFATNYHQAYKNRFASVLSLDYCILPKFVSEYISLVVKRVRVKIKGRENDCEVNFQHCLDTVRKGF